MSQFKAVKEIKKKQTKERKIHTYYEMKEGKIIRKLKKCPRCSAFMAHHKEIPRWTCGACSYTEYIKPEVS